MTPSCSKGHLQPDGDTWSGPVWTSSRPSISDMFDQHRAVGAHPTHAAEIMSPNAWVSSRWLWPPGLSSSARTKWPGAMKSYETERRADAVFLSSLILRLGKGAAECVHTLCLAFIYNLLVQISQGAGLCWLWQISENLVWWLHHWGTRLLVCHVKRERVWCDEVFVGGFVVSTEMKLSEFCRNKSRFIK